MPCSLSANKQPHGESVSRSVRPGVVALVGAHNQFLVYVLNTTACHSWGAFSEGGAARFRSHPYYRFRDGLCACLSVLPYCVCVFVCFIIYSGNTKSVAGKLGHVFTKTVQIETATEIFFSQ
jgi:hypothetical protein